MHCSAGEGSFQCRWAQVSEHNHRPACQKCPSCHSLHQSRWCKVEFIILSFSKMTSRISLDNTRFYFKVKLLFDHHFKTHFPLSMLFETQFWSQILKILYGNVQSNILRGLLAAAKKLGHKDKFYWIASDGWGKQQQVHFNFILKLKAKMLFDRLYKVLRRSQSGQLQLN